MIIDKYKRVRPAGTQYHQLIGIGGHESGKKCAIVWQKNQGIDFSKSSGDDDDGNIPFKILDKDSKIINEFGDYNYAQIGDNLVGITSKKEWLELLDLVLKTKSSPVVQSWCDKYLLVIGYIEPTLIISTNQYDAKFNGNVSVTFDSYTITVNYLEKDFYEIGAKLLKEIAAKEIEDSKKLEPKYWGKRRQITALFTLTGQVKSEEDLNLTITSDNPALTVEKTTEFSEGLFNFTLNFNIVFSQHKNPDNTPYFFETIDGTTFSKHYEYFSFKNPSKIDLSLSTFDLITVDCSGLEINKIIQQITKELSTLEIRNKEKFQCESDNNGNIFTIIGNCAIDYEVTFEFDTENAPDLTITVNPLLDMENKNFSVNIDFALGFDVDSEVQYSQETFPVNTSFSFSISARRPDDPDAEPVNVNETIQCGGRNILSIITEIISIITAQEFDDKDGFQFDSTKEMKFSFFLDWIEDDTKVVEVKSSFNPVLKEDETESTATISVYKTSEYRDTRGVSSGLVLKKVNVWDDDLGEDYDTELDPDHKLQTVKLSELAQFFQYAIHKEGDEYILSYCDHDYGARFVVFSIKLSEVTQDEIPYEKVIYGSSTTGEGYYLKNSDILVGFWGYKLKVSSTVDSEDSSNNSFEILGCDLFVISPLGVEQLTPVPMVEAKTHVDTTIEYKFIAGTSPGSPHFYWGCYPLWRQDKTKFTLSSVPIYQNEVYQGVVKKTKVASTHATNYTRDTLSVTSYGEAWMDSPPEEHNSISGDTKQVPDRTSPDFFWNFNDDVKYGKPIPYGAITYSDVDGDHIIRGKEVTEEEVVEIDPETGEEIIVVHTTVVPYDEPSKAYTTDYENDGTLEVGYKIPLYFRGSFICYFYQSAKRRDFYEDTRGLYESKDQLDIYIDLIEPFKLTEEDEVFPVAEGGRKFDDGKLKKSDELWVALKTSFKDESTSCHPDICGEIAEDIWNPPANETKDCTSDHLEKWYIGSTSLIKTIPSFGLSSGYVIDDTEESVHNIYTDIPVTITDGIQSVGALKSIRYPDVMAVWVVKMWGKPTFGFCNHMMANIEDFATVDKYVNDLKGRLSDSNREPSNVLNQPFRDALEELVGLANTLSQSYYELKDQDTEGETDEETEKNKEQRRKDIISLFQEYKRERYIIVANNFASYQMMETLPTGIAIYHI